MRLRLEKTCEACPEQYDAFLGEQRIGYLRLRGGVFRADYPDCGFGFENTVYVANPKGDGQFHDDERQHFLDEACKALLEMHQRVTDEGTEGGA
jgi:hypothetical protein